VSGAALRGPANEQVETLAEGAPIVLDVRLEAARPMTRPIFTFHVRNDKGQTVFELLRQLDAEVEPGRRIAFAGPVENRLVPGSYTLDVYLKDDAGGPSVAVQGLRLLHFSVEGSTASQGIVTAVADVEPVLE
jgi:hypothetical protein